MARRPWLSVIVPTTGRDTLPGTLKSVRWQAPPTAVELIVVGDSHQDTWRPTLEPVPALCAEYAARYAEYDDGRHMVGHGQREHGMALATGRWLLFSQDDSILVKGAIPAIQRAITAGPRCPYLFRVQTWQAGEIWREREVRLCNVDADMIVVPNVPSKLGTWERVYPGDFSFIRDTVARWRGQVQWEEPVIAIGRPTLRQNWTAWR